MWKAINEWVKPGVTEAYVCAKVNEYLYENGFDFVYDIIVASGGNTSPYRRWHTDKVIRQGDLMIIDLNAIGPGGYFVDFVRCFKVDGQAHAEGEGPLQGVLRQPLRGIGEVKPGATTAAVAEKFPVYDDDKYGTVSLQQFAHSIGLTLYEGMWISRAYSLDYPAEIKQNMSFAIETFAGHPESGADGAARGEPGRDRHGHRTADEVPVRGGLLRLSGVALASRAPISYIQHHTSASVGLAGPTPQDKGEVA